MATTSTPIFPQTINSSSQQILPADTTTLKTLYTGGANGSKVESILLTNTDTVAAYAIQFSVTISAVTYLLGTVNVPISSGNTIIAPAINALQSANLPLSFDAFGNPYLYLASGAVLKINSLTTVNTGKIVSATCTAAGDF